MSVLRDSGKSELAVAVGSDFAPSGRQFEISHGSQRAVIVEVGGGIREYRDGTRDILDPYRVEDMCDGSHGAALIPWPNRLAGGQYSFDGKSYQLPVSEPSKHNAIHGLLCWRNWELRSITPSQVVVGTVLRPMKGYPFCLDVRIAYELSDAGLRVTTSATNVGVTTAPWACGAHPYLSPGTGLVDDALLEFEARLRIETDARQLPVAVVPVAGTPYDFSVCHPIGKLNIDYAFAGLVRDAGRFARVRLTGADGRQVELWCDYTYSLIEIFTGDTLAPHRRRRGLGVEPMTAPPNAFASGEQVLRLEPGATTTHVWGVRLL